MACTLLLIPQLARWVHYRRVPVTAVSSPGTRPARWPPARQAPARPPPPPAHGRGNHSVRSPCRSLFLVPFAFIVSTALMTNQQMGSLQPSAEPVSEGELTDLFEFFRSGRSWNSLLYAGLGTVGVVLSGIRSPTPCPGSSGAGARPASSWSCRP